MWMHVSLFRVWTIIHAELEDDIHLYWGAVGCIAVHLLREWLIVSLFIYLFIGWSSRMTALLLYHSIVPCTSKDGISARAIAPWEV